MTNDPSASELGIQRSFAGCAMDIERVAILHSRLSGYMSACWWALKKRSGAELMVMHYAPAENAPFDEGQFDWIDHLCDRRSLSREAIQNKVAQFDPDAVLMAGWLDRDYLAVARHVSEQNIPVIAGCDTQWKGTLRQQVGRFVAPWYLHSAIDILWATGERQRQLARYLGFAAEQCWTGYYACDWKRFAGAHEPDRVCPATFLFVGRYIPRKGLDTLIAAYRHYRSKVDKPWSLVCAGTGELAPMLRQTPGVVDKGFVQPDELPELMRKGGVFVLPSRREPWGVVVQEAAAAGMPILCSTASGAGVHLVQHRYNGFSFEPEDADHLVRLMVRMHRFTPDRRSAMGRASHHLSRQFTPEQWAETFVCGVTDWKEKHHSAATYAGKDD
jgi:glycosyltransferase involved in cell wall biosynthesis